MWRQIGIKQEATRNPFKQPYKPYKMPEASENSNKINKFPNQITKFQQITYKKLQHSLSQGSNLLIQSRHDLKKVRDLKTSISQHELLDKMCRNPKQSIHIQRKQSFKSGIFSIQHDQISSQLNHQYNILYKKYKNSLQQNQELKKTIRHIIKFYKQLQQSISVLKQQFYAVHSALHQQVQAYHSFMVQGFQNLNLFLLKPISNQFKELSILRDDSMKLTLSTLKHKHSFQSSFTQQFVSLKNKLFQITRFGINSPEVQTINSKNDTQQFTNESSSDIITMRVQEHKSLFNKHI